MFLTGWTYAASANPLARLLQQQHDFARQIFPPLVTIKSWRRLIQTPRHRRKVFVPSLTSHFLLPVPRNDQPKDRIVLIPCATHLLPELMLFQALPERQLEKHDSQTREAFVCGLGRVGLQRHFRLEIRGDEGSVEQDACSVGRIRLWEADIVRFPLFARPGRGAQLQVRGGEFQSDLKPLHPRKPWSMVWVKNRREGGFARDEFLLRLRGHSVLYALGVVYQDAQGFALLHSAVFHRGAEILDNVLRYWSGSFLICWRTRLEFFRARSGVVRYG